MKKKKFEFSKLLVVIAVLIFAGTAIWSMIEYYTLVKVAIENGSDVIPDSTLAVTCITTILGTILSYCLYQGALKLSLNKNGLKVDEVTGIVRQISDGELLDAIEATPFPEQNPVDCEKE